MQILKRHGIRGGVIRGGVVAALALASMLAACGGAPSAKATPSPTPPCNLSAAPSAASVPPGAPVEDVCYASEWPSPNGDLYNTRVAHSTISSANVSKLGIAWTIPLRGKGLTGADVANPVIANGIAYVQQRYGRVTVDCGLPPASGAHLSLLIWRSAVTGYVLTSTGSTPLWGDPDDA